MRVLLLVDHGSRRAEANAQLEAVARGLQPRLAGGWQVRVAHLEIAPPDVASALDAAVAEGAQEIVLHPFFLAPGRHSQQDLPALVSAARARHAEVRIRMTAPLGPHEKLLEIVLERVAEIDGAE